MIYKQLCWTCSKACNQTQCVWVETLNKKLAEKEGVVFDSQGYITNCNNYSKDKKPLLITQKQKAKNLGVSINTYCKLVKQIKVNNLNTTPEQLYENRRNTIDKLKKREQKRKEHIKQQKLNLSKERCFRNQAKRNAPQLRITQTKYIKLCNEIDAKKLHITPEELYQQKIKEQINNSLQITEEKQQKSKIVKAQKLNISYFSYRNLCNYINENGLDITPEELFIQIQDKQKMQELERLKLEERRNLKYEMQVTNSDRAKVLGISYKTYMNILRKIKTNNLNTTPEELYISGKYKQKINRGNLNEIAKKLGISYQKCYILNNEIQANGLSLTIEELLEQKKQIQKKKGLTQKQKAEILGVNLYKYKYLVKEIKRKNLDITPEELYQQKQIKRGKKNDK